MKRQNFPGSSAISRSPVILGIDSTGPILKIATMSGKKIRQQTVSGLPHATRSLPLIAKILGTKKPDAIAVATGPGSYTGTRIGVTVANVLGWIWGVPVSGIPSSHAPTMERLLAESRHKFTQGRRPSLARPLYPTQIPRPVSPKSNRLTDR